MAGKIDLLLFHVRRHGAVGAIGASLIAGALLADAFLIHPLEGKRESMRERNALATVVMPARGRGMRAGDGEAGQVAVEVDATLLRMFRASKETGLRLDEGDYQLDQGREGGLTRYQITLPVQGAYADVRDFIARMLNENPALALASVTLRRPAIEENELDATVQFTLLLRDKR